MELLTNEHVEELQEATTPRGQILTSKHKQPVYIPNNPESELFGYVWKGPFAPDNPRLIMTRWRTECFRLMDSLVVLPEFIPDEAGMIWMRFENVGKVQAEKWTISTKRDTCEDRDVAIVDRESMGAGQLINESLETITEHMFCEERCLLLSYIDAAILATGDMGLWNALVNQDGESYIIDFSDCSHRTEITRWTHLFAKSGGPLTNAVFEKELVWIEDKVLEHLNTIALLLPQIEELAKKWGVLKIFKKYKIQWEPHRAITELRGLVMGPE